MEKNRVAVLYLGTRGGGVDDTAGLLRGLARHSSLRVSVFLSKMNPVIGEIKQMGFEVIEIRTNKPNISSILCSTLSLNWLQMIAALMRTKPQIVFVTMLHPWVPILFVFLKLFMRKTKVVYIRHNPPNFESIASSMNKILQVMDDLITIRSSLVVTFTDYVRSTLISSKMVDEHRVISIGFGVYKSYFERAKAWNHNGFSTSGPLRVLFFGRILPYKGVEVLIKAAVILKTRMAAIEITIAGEGELPTSYGVKHLEELGIRVINSWISDSQLSQLFSKTDVVVAPYTRASQAGPVNLATAFGLPLIVSNAGGLPELVVEGGNGLVVQAGSAEDLAQKLIYLSENRHELIKMSRTAKKYGEQVATWDKSVDRLVNFLHQHGYLDSSVYEFEAFSRQ